MERSRSTRWLLPIAALGGVAIGILGAEVTEGSISADQALHAFEHTYTDPGRCLHDTPYDPAKGAFIDVRHDKQSNAEILSDLPHAANFYKPSVLFMVVNRYTEFQPADHITAAFLGKALCPELPQT